MSSPVLQGIQPTPPCTNDRPRKSVLFRIMPKYQSDDIILGNALEEIENVENLQNFKMPEFCHSYYKGKPVSMFQGATITGNVTISFS